MENTIIKTAASIVVGNKRKKNTITNEGTLNWKENIQREFKKENNNLRRHCHREEKDI